MKAHVHDLTASISEVSHEARRQRLHPGALVELRFFDQQRAATIRGEVLRSTVSKLMAASIWYRGAIQFEHLLVWPPPTSLLQFPSR